MAHKLLVSPLGSKVTPEFVFALEVKDETLPLTASALLFFADVVSEFFDGCRVVTFLLEAIFVLLEETLDLVFLLDAALASLPFPLNGQQMQEHFS